MLVSGVTLVSMATAKGSWLGFPVFIPSLHLVVSHCKALPQWPWAGGLLACASVSSSVKRGESEGLASVPNPRPPGHSGQCAYSRRLMSRVNDRRVLGAWPHACQQPRRAEQTSPSYG